MCAASFSGPIAYIIRYHFGGSVRPSHHGYSTNPRGKKLVYSTVLTNDEEHCRFTADAIADHNAPTKDGLVCWADQQIAMSHPKSINGTQLLS